MSSSKIFLSYRRDDTEGYAGRLQDHLELRFPGRVFRDVSGLEPGEDYIDALQREGADCKVLIAVIGKHWLSLTDSAGKRRIDDPNDILRQEIVNALKRDIRVIPLLVGGASMPGVDTLPEDLAFLARRQALSISDVDFRPDMDRLIRVLEKSLGEAPSKPGPDDEKHHEEDEVSGLMRQAAAAAAAQDWTKASQTLQAVLSIDPQNAEAAGQLRTAVQHRKLSDVFGQGQTAFQRKDYRGALDCFRQVRVQGGNYNDVDNLIALCQESLKDSSGLVGPPKPKRLRWVLVGAGGFVILLVIMVAVQQQNDRNQPAPIVNGYQDRGAASNGGNTGQGQSPASSPSPGKTGRNPTQDLTDEDAGSDTPSPVPAVFNPVGRWTLMNLSTGAAATLFLGRDGGFTVTGPTGPLSAGRWVFTPATRTITMSGVNNVGIYFTELVTVANRRSDGFEAYDSVMGPILLSPQ